MSGDTVPVLLFSIATCTMWVATLVWAVRQREHRSYYVWVLMLGSVAWWLGECVAIRLGKYQYAEAFPGWLILPWGGSPSDSDWLKKGLTWLVGLVGLHATVPDCKPAQARWDIPFPIVALEATLVFAFLRLSVFRVRNKGLHGALATAGLSAVLIVTLAAILDPVVSTSQWCGALAPDSRFQGLSNVKLWQWFTNQTTPGYWFGVPLVNYVAWFVAVGTFTFLARFDDDGPQGIVRQYDHWFKYVLAAFGTLIILFLVQVPLSLGVDLVLVRGQEYLFPHPFFNQRAWEFGVIAVVLAVGFRAIRRFGQVHPNPRIEWVSIAPPLVIFVFCLVALLNERRLSLFVVWFLTAAIAGTVMFGPIVARWIVKFISRHWPTTPPVDTSPHA